MHNIEKSAFRRGEYVGYAHGVWIIRKSNSSYGTWSARHRDDIKRPTLFAFRLSDLSAKLDAIKA
jgi:hypothetical protein